MELIEQRFHWHRRFAAPIKAGTNHLLLISETASLLFDAAPVAALAPLLTQGQSLRAYLVEDPTGRMTRMGAMMQALSELAASGHVQPIEAHRAAPYVTPDFAKALATAPDSIKGMAIWNLSEALPSDSIHAWATHAAPALSKALPPTTSLVWCDDKLDPRLAQVEAWHRVHDKPWLLLKPAGAQACVGPLFNHGKTDAGCWHCLAERLAQQQAARLWAQRRHGDALIDPALGLPAVPVLCEAGLVRHRMQALHDMVMQVLQDPHPQTLRTWHEADAPHRHVLARRPQCPHCGDAGLRARLQREAIALQGQAVLPGAAGGSRTVPAERFVDRVGELVSPLLGPILELNAIDTPDMHAAAMHVYRSSFMRPLVPADSLPARTSVQVCLGKGRTAAQSQASALGEAIERLAASWQGDEAVHIASARELGQAAILPMVLPRVRSGHPEDALPETSFNEDAPIRWAPAWSLTHDTRRFLPLGYCFCDAPIEDRRVIGWTSNGCAAGHTREEAILQGLLELIERDATAIWWYGCISRPGWKMPSDTAASRCFQGEQSLSCLQWQPGPGWQTWMLNLTHDIGIPVAAAVAHHGARDEWALGFGCHLDARIAAERAQTELAQLIAVGKQLRIGMAEESRAFLRPRQCLENAANAARTSPSVHLRDTASQIRFIIGRLQAKGLEAIAIDHARPDLPLHTVKTAVPGLCHIWPPAPGTPPPARLREVPLSMGWLTNAAGTAQWNPQPLFV